MGDLEYAALPGDLAERFLAATVGHVFAENAYALVERHLLLRSERRTSRYRATAPRVDPISAVGCRTVVSGGVV